MGAVWSRSTAEPDSTESTVFEETVPATASSDDDERKRLLQEEMEKFKAEMAQKREARQEAIKALNSRVSALEIEKEAAIAENIRLKEELEEVKNGAGLEALKLKLFEERRQEDENDFDDDESSKDEIIDGLNRQVKALKDVAKIGGEMMKIRELQVNELKSKLAAIEETGVAYEKEVENMKKLRNLYEERARAMTISHQMELEREKSKLLAAEMRQKIAEHRVAEVEEKSKELEEKLSKTDGMLDEAKTQISELKIKLAGKNEDLYNVTSQMAVVNHLFGQLLSPGQDSLEKITKVLQENHDLVNHLTANGSINELASTLVEIADKDPLPGSEDQDDMSGHLSKVWRLLVELLGHHITKPAAPGEETPESCYKSVETPSGPKLVISVSQTFLRLKDLILEKNSLMKEVGRLKDLNSTLETRLLEQETRLSVVAGELCTTWNVVNKLKKQHANLHSSEQVLRYELAQKRLLLTELKKKLEECKENWSLARQKNSQTEKDWKLLRSEFALRKQQASSAESGYEESPTDSQDEEDNWKDDKNDKSSVSSEEENHCAILAWDDSDEQRTERRRTLTDSNPGGEDVPNFTMEHQVDACIVLPWTEPADGTAASGSQNVEEGRPCRRLSDCRDGVSDRLSRNPQAQVEPCNRLSGSYPSKVMRTDHESIGMQASPDGLSSALGSSNSSPASAFDACERLHDSRLEVEHSQDLGNESAEVSGVSCERLLQGGSDEKTHGSPSGPNVSDSRLTDDSAPSCSGTGHQPRERTAEEILQARQERLRRLEEGCQGLFSRMSRTNQRSEIINSRLTELHEIYGEERPSRRRPEEESPEDTPADSAEQVNPPTPPPFPEAPLFSTTRGGNPSNQ
ncbi:Pleckstrin homology domain containing, family F (With FYVE domain) member [Nesidiocoris tenuis]|uniref:Pleckstrin homology domain containing, family F (With FYVE domain) member n=1 Tax=Nesidiocoris tenuis TaxID=355587 RepID=A0ABN7BFX2_9HEMI|nr:Pleckstrin homology domain containing, family F (With FYVE domain) member [Nesidiocoris tenuis]